MYEGLTFFEVLWQFVLRFPALVMGSGLASDEIQFLVLNLTALTCSIVGTLSILRKYTMMANALSHTLLIGIVVVFFFGYQSGELLDSPLSALQLLLAASIGAALTAWLVHLFTSTSFMHEDAGIGASFSFLFALGILLLSVISRNAHIGVELLVGNADALVEEDIFPSLLALLVAVAAFIPLFRGWKVSSFDPIFGNLSGFSHKRYGALLLIIQAVTVVTAFRSVGVIMVLGLLCLPSLIARLYCSSLGSLVVVASSVALIVSTAAIALSRHLVSVYSFAVSTGALVVVLLAAVYVVCCVWTLRRSSSSVLKNNKT